MSQSNLLCLNADAVERVLTFSACLRVVRWSWAAHSHGWAGGPLRQIVVLPTRDARGRSPLFGTMPAFVFGGSGSTSDHISTGDSNNNKSNFNNQTSLNGTKKETVDLPSTKQANCDVGHRGTEISVSRPRPVVDEMDQIFSDGVFGMKLVAVCPANVDRTPPLPSHKGLLSLFAGDTGQPIAVVDAEEITTRRTSCMSGVATETLLFPSLRDILDRDRRSRVLVAILGTGPQAVAHALSSIVSLRNHGFWAIDIRVWGRDPDKAELVVSKISHELRDGPTELRSHQSSTSDGVDVTFTVVDSVQSAVRDAHIVHTCTASPTPIIDDPAWLLSGCHINAVGAFQRTTREIGSSVIAAARLYADNVESLRQEGGEYLLAIEDGRISADHLRGTIGDVIIGNVQGRSSTNEITVFKCLGFGVMDIAVAHAVVHYAKHEQTGVSVPW